MKKSIIKQTIMTAAMTAAALCAWASPTEGIFSVKAYGDFNLTRAYSLSSKSNCVNNSAKSSSDFGVDFGWMFYQVENCRFSANIGLSVSPGKQTLTLQPSEFNYSAGPEADMDGDSYIRYVTTSAISQTLKTIHVGVPIYVDADIRVHRIVSVYGQLGFNSMFNACTNAGAIKGKATAWGMYPQYDDLIIDAPLMNAFGETDLSKGMSAPVKAKTFVPELIAGLGVRVNVYEPLWVELGFNYRYSGNIYDCAKAPCPNGTVTPEASPVTYTAADGLRVKSPVDYLVSNRRNTLMLSLGLIYKF